MPVLVEYIKLDPARVDVSISLQSPRLNLPSSSFRSTVLFIEPGAPAFDYLPAPYYFAPFKVTLIQ